ncbi:uncharacterized protein [Penaeus vannamei]|uniref:uncharacterized protein n=1 Tax=Penaeus vannamei TaxID=6689 RepID=UPI00387F5F3D
MTCHLAYSAIQGFEGFEAQEDRQYPPIPPLDITTNGIQNLLSTLDTNKATGPDQIPDLILKSCALALAPILQSIFSQSLASFTLPTDWLYRRDTKQVDAILLDFAKAFDKVPHKRLTLKLRHYGITGPILH